VEVWERINTLKHSVALAMASVEPVNDAKASKVAYTARSICEQEELWLQRYDIKPFVDPHQHRVAYSQVVQRDALLRILSGRHDQIFFSNLGAQLREQQSSLEVFLMQLLLDAISLGYTKISKTLKAFILRDYGSAFAIPSVGFALLATAAIRGNIQILKYLLSIPAVLQGINSDSEQFKATQRQGYKGITYRDITLHFSTNLSHYTPLHLAIKAGHQKVVELLWIHVANPLIPCQHRREE
jgi:hypothetical protein